MAAKRFPAGLRLFRSRQQDDHVVRIDPAEHAAGLLVQDIAVDFSTADKPDAMLPMRTLGAQTRAFFVEFRDLPGVFDTGLQPALPVKRMPNEIRRHAARNGVEHERHEEGAEARADDHSVRMRRFA